MCLSTTASSSTLLGIQSRFENIHLNYQSRKNLNGKYTYLCILYWPVNKSLHQINFRSSFFQMSLYIQGGTII